MILEVDVQKRPDVLGSPAAAEVKASISLAETNPSHNQVARKPDARSTVLVTSKLGYIYAEIFACDASSNASANNKPQTTRDILANPSGTIGRSHFIVTGNTVFAFSPAISA